MAQEDLWDFGTVRHVHARPGTLRKAQVAATGPIPFAHPATPARSPAPAPKPTPASPATPKQAPPIARDFATVKLAPGSAHSEYSDFSSSASVDGADRARVELDREQERLRRERARTPEPEPELEERRQQNGSGDSDEEGGNILDTVVLPVIDSVRSAPSLSP